MNKEPITVEGLEKLKLELDQLKNVKRPQIVSAIAEARSHGDLKENAEYHAAKEQQAQMESRVIEINDIIARANVIDIKKIENNGNVIFGSTVTVKDLEVDKKKTYKIVGKDEADISKGYLTGLPRDPWGNAYEAVFKPSGGLLIKSLGPDGISQNSGEGDDEFSKIFK